MKAGEAAEKSETLPAWRAETERIFLDVQGFPGLFFGSKMKQHLLILKGKKAELFGDVALKHLCVLQQKEGATAELFPALQMFSNYRIRSRIRWAQLVLISNKQVGRDII